MALFSVTFRIHYGDGKDYTERLSKVKSSMSSKASGEVWEGATSLYMFESSSSADSILSAIKYSSGYTLSKDSVLVTNLSHKLYAHHGYSPSSTTTLVDLMKSR